MHQPLFLPAIKLLDAVFQPKRQRMFADEASINQPEFPRSPQRLSAFAALVLLKSPLDVHGDAGIQPAVVRFYDVQMPNGRWSGRRVVFHSVIP